MKAVLLNAVNELVVTEIPTPTPGPGELVIKMLACGICGTDRHILVGEHPAKMPLVLGHEFGGTVTAVGENVDFKIASLSGDFYYFVVANYLKTYHFGCFWN